MITGLPVGYYLVIKAKLILSSIGRFLSATIAIVGIQLAGFGLLAISDATCMQVNALIDLSDVMMRLRCRKKVSMRSKTRQDIIAQPGRQGRQLEKGSIDECELRKDGARSPQLGHTYTS